MKRYLVMALLPALAASLVFAARPARAAFPDYRTVAAKHPRSDAVVLFDSLVVAMDAGGRIAKRHHRAVMLFTDNAINRYGDPRILFDADRQELRIITARVYMRDGSAVDTKPNGINRTTPFGLDLAPDYTGWQETVVTHVGIEKGCVAELEYEIAGKEASPFLSGVEIFSAQDPVELRVLVVRPPAGEALKTAGMNGAPEAVRSGGAWTWIVRDIPGRTPFDGGVWEGDYSPAVSYSTAASWQEALSKLGADLDSASAVFPAADEPVEAALKDLVTDEEKILAVQRLAIGAVREIRAPFSLLAAPPRNAARIYDTGYASPLDRGVLLAAMLRSAGFEPKLELVSAGRIAGNDVPAPELFGAVMISVAAKDAGGLLLDLDPGSPHERNTSFALTGKTVVSLEDTPAGRKRMLPLVALPPPQRLRANGSPSTLELKLAPGENGKLSGSGRAVLGGVFSPYYIIRSGASVEEYIRERVQRLFSDAELVSCNPLSLDRDWAEIEFTCTVELPDKRKGERIYLTVPRPFDAAVAGIERVPLERSAISDAMRIEPCKLSVSCSIELPPGWRLICLPAPEAVRNDVGSGTVGAEETSDGRHRVVSQLLLERDIVTPDLYGDLRKLLAVGDGALIVLEKE